MAPTQKPEEPQFMARVVLSMNYELLLSMNHEL